MDGFSIFVGMVVTFAVLFVFGLFMTYFQFRGHPNQALPQNSPDDHPAPTKP